MVDQKAPVGVVRAPSPTGRRFAHLRNRYLFLGDASLLPLAALVAFAVRYDGVSWPVGSLSSLAAFVALALPLKLLVMWSLGLYSRMWRYAGVEDLQFLAAAAAGASIAGAMVGLWALPVAGLTPSRLPLVLVVLDGLLGTAAIAVPRLFARMGSHRRREPTIHCRRVLIVGAGTAGAMIVRELQTNPQLGLVPVALLDDDPSKQHRRLHGVEIVGTLADLGAVVAPLRIDEIVIAMPSVAGAIIRDVVRRARVVGMPTRTVPGLFELLNGRKAVSALRKVEIEDLLRREPVATDLVRVRSLAEGRTVLVTGAGGSIGSELCRQIAQLRPVRLIAVGRGENSIFELMQDLAAIAPDASVQPVIADVRDEARMEQLFRTTRPHIVFHAAAHKHVPLMEENVAEAILNNVHGTRVVTDAAWRHGTERFVLISSDKAVRPTSVMGATKRMAEGVLQRYAGDKSRHFVSVRFGNVLGSRGSVIPTFLRQLQAGGPVTITHRDMKRYFMTIPEAVQLVLQAGVLAEDAEVFVLDMGEPVRIYDLASDLIRLSGLEVDNDIEILETGIRPGEKLFEELFFDAEHVLPTAHPKVLRARNASLPLNAAALDALVASARAGAPVRELRQAIRMLVPEYTGAADAPAPRHAPSRPAAEPAVARAALAHAPAHG